MIDGNGYAWATREGDSFRAEGYGQLAIVRLLLHIQRYTNRSIQSQLTLWTDNEGLITRVGQSIDRKFKTARATQAPHHDIVQALHDTIKELQQDFPLMPIVKRS